MPGQLLPEVPAIPSDGVLLHVGVHKTGTTAIQAAFADARVELAELGVTYPGRQQAQHRAALAVLQRHWGWNKAGGQVLDRSHFDRLSAKTRSSSGRVVISSEFWCEADDDKAAMTVRELGDERVHIVITLRNLGRLLPSSWQQYLKYGITAPYEQWLQDIFTAPGSSKATPTFWRRHAHGDVVRRWAAVASPDRVTVMILEDVDLSAQYVAFAQLLGIPSEVLVGRMGLTSNRSMTAAEAEVLRRLNAQVKPTMVWDDYVRLVRRGVALGLVEGREPAPDEPRLSTPDWALDAAAEQGSIAADAIAASGVRVLGDLQALRTRVPSTPQTEPGGLPIEAAVTALASVITARGEDPSTRQLLAALRRKAKAKVGRA